MFCGNNRLTLSLFMLVKNSLIKGLIVFELEKTSVIVKYE